MMNDDQQHVIVVCHAEKSGAEQGPASEIERPAKLIHCNPLCFFFTLGKATQVSDGHARR